MASPADLINKQNEIHRPVANFPENIWTDIFNSFTVDKQEYDMHSNEIEKLKEEVRSMLIGAKEKETIEKLNLIDTVERLGISYHFEKEIEELVEEIFHQINANFEENQQNDLFSTALLFRILRQHGYDISSGIFFQSFLNDNEKFKPSLISDVKGLLSLYEATQLRTRKDSILEEALSFATTHLKSGEPKMPTFLAKQVNRALEHSLHKDIPRVSAHHYISVYGEFECGNPLLLRLAKLDFRLLQILHRQELHELFRWSMGLKIRSNVPYSRERVVECYFWALGTIFEPQHSLSRIILAKTTMLISVVDDTYDAYGTLDELKVFRDAVERWDVGENDHLPEYMKSIYMAILGLSECVNEELTKMGKPYAFLNYKEEWKQYVRASYTQSCWFLRRALPSFPEYKEVALITSAQYLLITAALLVLETATKDVFDWLCKNPKIVAASAEISRFLNDVASYESEKQRGATGPECYMMEYNVSEDEAMEKFEEIGENSWKDMNEESLKPKAAAMTREILMPILNITRMSDAAYSHREDGYTNPHGVLKRLIISLLVDSIIV